MYDLKTTYNEFYNKLVCDIIVNMETNKYSPNDYYYELCSDFKTIEDSSTHFL
jgi:hypothetical protein